MGKRKTNPSIDGEQRQDELNLESSQEKQGTIEAPPEPAPGASAAPVQANDALNAEQDEQDDGGKEAEAKPVIRLPAFAMDGLWHGAAMAATPVRAFRLRRLLALGATVAFAAALGALAGSFATAGLSTISGDRSEQEATLKLTLQRMERELSALRTSVYTSAQDIQARAARIAERLDRSERAQAEPSQKLAKITETLERLERRNAPATQASAAAAADVTGSIGEPRNAAEAKKLSLVNNWALLQVRGGVALIEGRDGLIEVEPGDMLPGLGRVEAIRKQEGRWVVVTSRGLIAEQR